jgi:hypothetical protein
MTSSDLIEMLQEFEEEAGGPVQVHVLMQNGDRNLRFTLDQFDLNLESNDTGSAVLIDLS